MRWLAMALAAGMLTAMALAFGETPEDAKKFRLICVNSEAEREMMRALMFEGIDLGFRDKVHSLFDNMVRDTTDQPARAARGLSPAVKAYTYSRVAVQAWDPPICQTPGRQNP
jgi:hypothetical protein